MCEPVPAFASKAAITAIPLPSPCLTAISKQLAVTAATLDDLLNWRGRGRHRGRGYQEVRRRVQRYAPKLIGGCGAVIARGGMPAASPHTPGKSVARCDLPYIRWAEQVCRR
jgi:hypothetical protein